MLDSYALVSEGLRRMFPTESSVIIPSEVVISDVLLRRGTPWGGYSRPFAPTSEL